MSVQGSINQGLSILGALYTQTPMYKEKTITPPTAPPSEEEGTAKAAESLRRSIEKKEYQKSRVGQFYKSLKDQSFIREVKDGKSIK